MNDHPSVVTAVMENVVNNNEGGGDGVSGDGIPFSSSDLLDPPDDKVGSNIDIDGNHKDGDWTVRVVQSMAPSHILEDGRFIYLPPPNAAERSRFFERSIARYGLLEADMSIGTPSSEKTKTATAVPQQEDKNVDEDDDEEDKTAPKIHPLAIASARLQANGLNELNRAINLATLVSTGEYFSYSNVVDPSLEANAGEGTTAAKTTPTTTTTAATPATASKKPDAIPADAGGEGGVASTSASSPTTSGPVATTAVAATLAMTQQEEEDQLHRRTAAMYCLKRKRTQYERASAVLARHAQRLGAAVTAQHVLDSRLFQLRQRWRLVAPEHGTRARLHAARTNEVIAVDVDVYDRDRVLGGGSVNAAGTISSTHGMKKTAAASLAGRLASRVPRFATIELKDGFKAHDVATAAPNSNPVVTNNGTTNNDKERGPLQESIDERGEGNRLTQHDGATAAPDDRDVPMEGSDTDGNDNENAATTAKLGQDDHDIIGVVHDDVVSRWTRAEPFAVADPTLGRVMENFDPTKIPMLNLQLEIQKSSTGFLQLARLEPLRTMTTSKVSSGSDGGGAAACGNNGDEDLLISLQHSLFCANLFESIRSELDNDYYAGASEQKGGTIGRGNTTAGPSFSPSRNKTLQSMAWLASESEENFVPPPSVLVGGDEGRGLAALSVIHCHEGEVKVQLDREYSLCVKLVEANADDGNEQGLERKSSLNEAAMSVSGSQSPALLHALCRALLLHAQDVYHRHSLYLRRREKKKRQEEAAQGDAPRGLARIKKEDIPEQARILQSCVSLGSKMLLERRIRKTLSNVSKWVQTDAAASRGDEELLAVEWLPLSIFDLHSRCSVCFRQLLVDVEITHDELTVTRITNKGDYRKVHFRSETEFELFLKLAIRREMYTST